ncbi:hypothetical protein ACFXKG_15190 [Streptomyces sp. NPDC059255]
MNGTPGQPSSPGVRFIGDPGVIAMCIRLRAVAGSALAGDTGIRDA